MERNEVNCEFISKGLEFLLSGIEKEKKEGMDNINVRIIQIISRAIIKINPNKPKLFQYFCGFGYIVLRELFTKKTMIQSKYPRFNSDTNELMTNVIEKSKKIGDIYCGWGCKLVRIYLKNTSGLIAINLFRGMYQISFLTLKSAMKSDNMMLDRRSGCSLLKLLITRDIKSDNPNKIFQEKAIRSEFSLLNDDEIDDKAHATIIECINLLKPYLPELSGKTATRKLLGRRQPRSQRPPVRGSSPVRRSTPVRGSSPVCESSPVRESTPVCESTPVRESSPVCESSPVRDPSPISESNTVFVPDSDCLLCYPNAFEELAKDPRVSIIITFSYTTDMEKIKGKGSPALRYRERRSLEQVTQWLKVRGGNVILNTRGESDEDNFIDEIKELKSRNPDKNVIAIVESEQRKLECERNSIICMKVNDLENFFGISHQKKILSEEELSLLYKIIL